LLGIVVHGSSSLLEVHELLAFLPHHACGASGGVVGPPRAGVTSQLLRGEEGLLHLSAAQEPELRLHHPKLVVDLKRLSCLVKSGGCVAVKSL
jgi:hypothetical protein